MTVLRPDELKCPRLNDTVPRETGMLHLKLLKILDTAACRFLFAIELHGKLVRTVSRCRLKVCSDDPDRQYVALPIQIDFCAARLARVGEGDEFNRKRLGYAGHFAVWPRRRARLER